MGNYNDFDLDIKKLQTEKDDQASRFTSLFSCDDSCTGETKYNTCGGLTTSCSGHCR